MPCPQIAKEEISVYLIFQFGKMPSLFENKFHIKYTSASSLDLRGHHIEICLPNEIVLIYNSLCLQNNIYEEQE